MHVSRYIFIITIVIVYTYVFIYKINYFKMELWGQKLYEFKILINAAPKEPVAVKISLVWEKGEIRGLGYGNWGRDGTRLARMGMRLINVLLHDVLIFGP